jgi:hypothetical protein
MAAAQAALNNYLDAPLGITEAATRAALNQQGLQSFDDFLTLTEKDISEICTNLRKPGGTIPNPAYNAAAPVVGIPATIPNPGINVGHVFEKRLKMLRFYLLHLQRIQRNMTPATATLARLTTCYNMKEIEDNEEEEELPGKLVRVDKVRDVIENIDHYLNRKRGSSGLPLAYVVRDEVNLPLIDPGYGMPTTAQEMIARGPHFGTYYQIDNQEVWQVIRHCTHGGPGWSWVQSHQRASDGRGAYLALKLHYLGEAYSSRIRAAADNTIDSAYYDGKSRAFSFEKYCEVLKAAFTDIEVTGEEVSETRKVRVLLHGIKDKRLETAVSQVLATQELRASFETALNFIAKFADELRSLDTSNRAQQMRNVSATSTHRGGRSGGNNSGGRNGNRNSGGYKGAARGNGRGGGRGGRHNPRWKPEDRYYPYDEWVQLTKDQQDKVRDLNKKRSASTAETSRNTRPNSSDGRTNNEQNETTASTIRSSEVGAMMSNRKSSNNREL